MASVVADLQIGQFAPHYHAGSDTRKIIVQLSPAPSILKKSNFQECK
jgi:hypothetical protein